MVSGENPVVLGGMRNYELPQKRGQNQERGKGNRINKKSKRVYSKTWEGGKGITVTQGTWKNGYLVIGREKG